MAKERIEERNIDGNINVSCKYDDGTIRYWTDDKRSVVNKIVAIVKDYSSQGYKLTLRQLHYQMVGHDPNYVNHDTAYKKLGSILDDCRYGGLIDWFSIEDRGRIPHIPYSVKDVEDALKDAADTYRINRQEGQDTHVEVWTEKDALSGIFKRVTDMYHIRLVVNKGYTSSSAAYRAYNRFVERIVDGQQVIVLYFGDHDPSGLDMIRDITDRIMTFMCNGYQLKDDSSIESDIESWWNASGITVYDIYESGYLSDRHVAALNKGEDSKLYEDAVDSFYQAKIRMFIMDKKLFQVIPIGLTMQQITKYKLPPNPTKLTDSRSDKYIESFGKKCWEVDALKPNVLTQIVEKNIQKCIDVDVFNKVCSREQKEIRELKKIINERKKK